MIRTIGLYLIDRSGQTASKGPLGQTPERLQAFIASLSGLPPDEVQKAKLLFIRNEILHLRALKESLSVGKQIVFAIIPVFWPILWSRKSRLSTALAWQNAQIRNMLAVWGGDLEGQAASLEAELSSVLAG